MSVNVIFWLLMLAVVVASYSITFNRMTKGMTYQYSLQGFAPAVLGLIIGAIIVVVICVGVYFLGIAKALGITFPI